MDSDDKDSAEPNQWGGREGARSIPFVRQIRWQLHNCGATNKSQFAFGGIALLMLLALLDVVGLFFFGRRPYKFWPR